MDHKFTELIKKWLEMLEAERDYTVGHTLSFKTFE